MFTPLPMQRVTIFLTADDAPRAALALARLGEFEPGVLNGALPFDRETGEEYRGCFAQASGRLAKIAAHFGRSPDEVPRAPRVIGLDELRELDRWLGDTWHECSRREESARQIREELRTVDHLNDVLDAYEPLDVDLGLLHERYRFLDLRLGTVPVAGIERLREALGLLNGTLQVFKGGERVRRVLVASPRDVASQVDRVLSAASFAELSVPPEFAARPRDVRRRLEARASGLRAQLHELDEERDRAAEACAARLGEAVTRLDHAAGYARLSAGLKRSESLAGLAGWVPAAHAGEVDDALRTELGESFALEIRRPTVEELSSAPSAMRHSRWLAPFAELVRNYGVPRYGELDPTWFFAVSFVLMFGMMFGDVGHGAVIAAGGVLARRRLRGFAPFVVAIGIASVVFGVAYGSVFGYEELFHPLWIAPLSDPERMLRVALYWGIGFIVAMTLVMVCNQLRSGAWAVALLSGHGLAGAVFYLSLIYAVAQAAAGAPLGPAATSTVLISLAVLMLHEWRHSDAPDFERAIVVVIEAFETAIGFAANTLSFLRVAAFSMNHVALAIAVFTMAEMMGPTGHWVTVVLGNVFILVLEGAIVTIQVLRLEYYEGFSRFFSGDGRAFRPLRFDARDAAVESAN